MPVSNNEVKLSNSISPFIKLNTFSNQNRRMSFNQEEEMQDAFAM
jgi:hypothetical protein